MYTNLVLSSGALKGFIILGCLKNIEKDLENIKEYTGCSVGSIINFFLLLNYKIDDIYDIFLFEFQNFLNLFEQKYNINNIDDYIITFFYQYGIIDHTNLQEVLIKYLKQKHNKTSITFLECAKIFGKNFIVNSSNVSKHTTVFFDINNTPDMNIIDAICMSCAIPFIVKPIKYKDDYYVDGALYHEFPLKYFSKNKLETIGIYIDYDFHKNKYSNILEYIYYMYIGLIKNNNNLQENNIDFKKFNIYKININQLSNDLKKLDIDNTNEIIISNDSNLDFNNFKYKLNKTIIKFYYNYGLTHFNLKT